MTDLSEITMEELEKDLREAKEDLDFCRQALAAGIETYGEHLSVHARIKGNLQQIEVIRAEIKKRLTPRTPLMFKTACETLNARFANHLMDAVTAHEQEDELLYAVLEELGYHEGVAVLKQRSPKYFG